MILHYLSASRLKTYLQCTEKYHQAYENGVKAEAEHLRFGTAMHSVFERWFQEDTDIRVLFEQEWLKANLASPQLYKEGLGIVDLFEENNDRNEIVPLGFEIPFAIDILNDEIYETDGVDFSDPKQVRAFLNELKEKDTPIIFGFIDRVDFVPEDDSLKIVDYKTSRVALSQYESNEDVQLSMYALVAQYLFPDYEKVVEELHYVREGTVVRTRRTNEELDTFKNWLLTMFDKIKSDTTPKETLNRFCGWCDSRHGCFAYQELVNGEADPDFIPEDVDLEELDTELDKIGIHLKILKDREKEIKNIFQDTLRQRDNHPIALGTGERYLTQNTRVSYDPITVLSLFSSNLEEVLSVNKAAVDKLAKEDPEARRALEETSSSYLIAPTLRKKKSKQ